MNGSTMIRFVDLQRQYQSIKAEIDDAIDAVLSSSSFILGPAVDEFERAFADYCEARYCIGVGSGTDALSLALAAVGIGAGDEVIVPANTFIATAFAVSRVGATPVLVDVDEDTMLATADIVEKAISTRTKGVIPVHLFGSPVDMGPLVDLARRRNLAVIEDACQAHGARYGEARVGGLGTAAAFSFYPGKNLGAYGDGGAVVTNDEQIAASVRLFRDLGQRKKYEHVVRGFNSRLDSMQAKILSVKLRHLDDWNDARRERASWYDEALDSEGLERAPASPGESVYHLYAIRLKHRDAALAALRDSGIECGIHYPVPIHLQKAYENLGHRCGAFPVSERWSRHALSLPMFAELSREEVRRVVELVVRVGGRKIDRAAI